tara:strand:+ start:4713 stop:5114 length:402 start_codon:yes stop_codon:yes gene_type:complete
MSKVKIIKEFNSILESFLSQLSGIIGTSYHRYFKNLVKINAILPIQQFSNNVYIHKEKIMNEDESYFFNNLDNQKQEINSFNTYFKIDQETTLTEILRLTNVYFKLDDESKKEAWAYFKALTILSEDYINLSK